MAARSDYKQVIAVRTDLDMGKGKIAAQAAHASVEAVFLILDSGRDEWRLWLREWRRSGQKKVVVRVSGEKELMEVYEKALRIGLPAVIIADAGLTQIPPGTRTAVAVGPGPTPLIDQVTGGLKLL